MVAVGADVARDGLTCDVSARVRNLHGPDALVGEGIERKLSELPFRKRLGRRRKRIDLCSRYLREQRVWEIERRSHLGLQDVVGVM